MAAPVVECSEDAATIHAGFVDTGMPLAGPGAPLVSEFAFMELAAILDRSHESARLHVGRIIETAWRLPQVSAAVLAGRCPLWKTLRVADHTRCLNADAAGLVDRHLGFCVGTATWAQPERLVAEAIALFDPEQAEEDRKAAADDRCFDIHEDRTDRHGLTPTSGWLDAADAADLDTAVSRRAKQLADLGCEESLDVRRAIAVGELARSDLALDLQVLDPETGEVTKTVPGRKVELFVHLTDAALRGVGGVGRWDHRQPCRSPSSRSANGAACPARPSWCGR